MATVPLSHGESTPAVEQLLRLLVQTTAEEPLKSRSRAIAFLSEDINRTGPDPVA